ncbi:hypothetical protein Tco_1364105, partial [Tanacetum coccineum]
REFSYGGAYVDFKAEAQFFVGIVRSDDRIVQAGSRVDGLSSVRGIVVIEGLIRVLVVVQAEYSAALRNLGPRCLLTGLPDEWMRTEVVEEELEQN